MKLARVTTVAVGGLATAIATVMAGMNIQSLWETFAALMALIGGGFPGIFALGLLTRRANAPGVAIGLLASIVDHLCREDITPPPMCFSSPAWRSARAWRWVTRPACCSRRTAKPLAGLTIHTLQGGQDARRGADAEQALAGRS